MSAVMAGRVFEFETGALTHPGRVRSRNEDSLACVPASGLWVVADGMGGHMAGDFASQAISGAIATVGIPSSAPDLEARFMDRLGAAHDAIRRRAAEMGGTTIGALMIFGSDYAVVWSGDSRCYRLRDGVLDQLTTDHTEVQALIARGALSPEEAARWPRRNVITRAIGVFETPETEIVTGKAFEGDAYLLCSDGLTEHVEAHEIGAALAGADPQAACEALVALTLDRGARDNVSVVVVRLEQPATIPGVGAGAVRRHPYAV